MPPTIHVIDPEYDTIIVLTDPCKNFAPWDPTADIPEHVAPELQREPEGKLVIKQDDDDDQDWGSLIINERKHSKRKGRKSSFLDEGEKTSVLVSGAAQAVVTELSHNVDYVFSSEDTDAAGHTEEEVIHYLVSSRHLTLPSPWFKRALRSAGSREAVPLSDGYLHVPASEWDEAALLALLNILHLRKRQVSKEITLEMLAQIAVLVDYYELKNEEAIADNVDAWVDYVRSTRPVPTHYGRDLMLWICVSATFDLSLEFEKATAVAIQESTGAIQTLGLPIRQSITRRFAEPIQIQGERMMLTSAGEIEQKRIHAIDSIISQLHLLLDKYRAIDYSCPHKSPSFYCGALLFGTLHKEMEKWGFLAGRPENPFLGSSLRGVCSKMDAVRSPIWLHKVSDVFGSPRLVNHSCSLKEEIDFIVQTSTESVGGIKLSDLEGGL